MNENKTRDSELLEPSASELKAIEDEVAEFNRNRVPMDENDSIGQMIRKAEQALRFNMTERDRKILSNIRLVPFFAKKYLGRGLDIEDMVQEGLIGMMKAVDTHDPSKGALSTWASWWIKCKIRRALDDQSKTIRLPTYVNAERYKIKRTAAELEIKLGRRPTLEEISQSTGFNLTKISDAFAMKGTVAASMQQPISAESDSGSLDEFIEDTSIPHPDVALIEREASLETKRAEIVQRLKSLTAISDKKKAVFTHFNCLDSTVRIYRTLESTGERFDITRERVRQIVDEVEQRLNHIINKAPRYQSHNVKLKEKRGQNMKLFHIRATPAFVNWRPKNGSDDLATSLFDFIASSYELTAKELRGVKKREDMVWARSLIGTLMVRDLRIDPIRVEARFNGSFGPMKVAMQLVDSVMEKDPVIRSEIESMRKHFKNVAKLQP